MTIEDIKIVSPEEAEESDFLVGARVVPGQPLMFPDNMVSPCAECGAEVQFRPTAPQKPQRICEVCAAGHGFEPDAVHQTTQHAIDEAIQRMSEVRDIKAVLNTTNDLVLEAQAKLWPGIEVFRAYGWDCHCGEPDCFRTCLQKFGSHFPTPEDFAHYLELIEGCTSTEQMIRIFSADFARLHALDDEDMKHIYESMMRKIKEVNEGLPRTLH